MAVTLAQAKLNVQDDLQMGIIDEFAKSSYLLDHLTFDDAVSPTGGGATLTYSYTRQITQPTAGTRAINQEYTPSEVTKQRYSVDLKIFGGAYQVDRVIAKMGGIANEVEWQQAQKIKATAALFSDTVINGDSGTDANSFDGLSLALKDSVTEIASGGIDLSTSALVTSNYLAFTDMLDEFLANLDREPDALLVNTKMKSKILACAKRASMYQTTKDSWGRDIGMYGNIAIVDLGAKAGSNDPIVATSSGLTDIYAVSFGLDAFHGVSMAGAGSPIVGHLPDFNTGESVVRQGDVEMVAAVALKTTKSCGVLRGVKVSA